MIKARAMDSGSKAAIAVSFNDHVSVALNSPSNPLRWADQIPVMSMVIQGNKSAVNPLVENYIDSYVYEQSPKNITL
jgi:hypothetical protein